MYARAHTPMKPNLEETLAKNGRKTFKVKCFFSGLLILNETQGERESFISTIYLLLYNHVETKRARIKVQKSLHLLKMNEGGDVQCVGQNKEHLLTGGSGKKRCKKSS